MRNLLFAAIMVSLLLPITSCNSNKIACPTYAGSFPEKKSKGGSAKKPEPQMPRASKPTSGVMPGRAK